jgi:cell division transport system permease protein
MIFARRSDLPLDKDPATRFLPWLIAFMVFLAVLAMAGVLVLHQMSARWDSGLSGTLTVQVPPADILKGAPSDARRLADMNTKRLDDVLAALRDVPEISHTEVLPETRIQRLLKPWLGEGASVAGLPLPQLIDVRTRAGAEVDEKALGERLRAAAPGTRVDSHRVWLNRLLSLLRSIQALALAVLGFIVAATVGTVVFTTRTGLAVHFDVIEVLHLTGAHDTYIARQFGQHALGLGLKGGLLGLALALPTLWVIGWLAGDGAGGLLPKLALGPLEWAAVALIPVAVATLAMVTARRTVLRSLARMP